MGAHLRERVTFVPFQYLIIRPGQLTLSISQWVGKMSTGNGVTTTGDENGECDSRPCYQHCWHTDLVG